MNHNRRKFNPRTSLILPFAGIIIVLLLGITVIAAIVTGILIMNGVLKMVFDIILYLFLIIQTFFGYLSMALVITTLVYHYGSNAREQDDLAIASDIENFENL